MSGQAGGYQRIYEPISPEARGPSKFLTAFAIRRVLAHHPTPNRRKPFPIIRTPRANNRCVPPAEGAMITERPVRRPAIAEITDESRNSFTGTPESPLGSFGCAPGRCPPRDTGSRSDPRGARRPVIIIEKMTGAFPARTRDLVPAPEIWRQAAFRFTPARPGRGRAGGNPLRRSARWGNRARFPGGRRRPGGSRYGA